MLPTCDQANNLFTDQKSLIHYDTDDKLVAIYYLMNISC